MATLLPNGKQYYTTNEGLPLVGGKLYTYEAGTLVPKLTYQDADATVPNTNPVIMDARGEAVIFWTGVYKIELRDSIDNVLWTIDDVASTDEVIGSAVQELIDDLANTTDLALGDAMIGVRQPYVGTIARTQHDFNAQYISVKDFGAVGDGVADDTAAIQAAIDASFAQSSRFEIFVPPGRYRLASRLTVKQSIKLRGASHLPNISNGLYAYQTAFYIDWGAGQNEDAIRMELGSGLEGFAFFYPGQVDKDMKIDGVVQPAPVTFGWTISTDPAGVAQDNIQLKNLSFMNSYKAIRMIHGARWRISDIQGDPIRTGFEAGDCFDTCYMNGVHFWPFNSTGINTPLGAWTFQNGTGFEMFRVDSCMVSDILIFGRAYGWSSREQFWGDITGILTDTCLHPYFQVSAGRVRISNFEFIGSGAVWPAIWYEDGGLLALSNGLIGETNSVGMQIGGSGGTVLVENVEFTSHVFSLVSTGTAVNIKVNNCKYNVPPWGGQNVSVNGMPLPAASTLIALGAPIVAPPAIAGGFTFNLAAVGASNLQYDMTFISERNSLWQLSFDYKMIGDSSQWKFGFIIASDVGADIQVSYQPQYPLRLNLTPPGTPTRRVTIPFFIGMGFFKQVMTLRVSCDAAVPGAALEITNIVLTEQTNILTTDAQVAMMMKQGYNLDANQMGQTLMAKGKNRIVITQSQAGIGRPTEVPIAGAWIVGDEVRVFNPVAGGFIGYVCVAAGTPGTWKSFGAIAA